MGDDTPLSSTADACARAFRDTGEPQALGALYDATAPVLFRVALTLAPDAASAEDALQETYLTASAILGRWDASRPVLPWLLGVLRWKVREARRRARRVPEVARLAAARPVPTEDPPCDGDADAERVRAAIDALPEPYRGVAILRWRYGLSPAQIAHARDEAPGTTSSLLSRALERLRKALRGGLPTAFFGPRAPRGLDAVRASVVGGVAAGAVAGAAAGGTLALVAAIALAVGGGAWVVARGASAPADEAPPRSAVAGTPGAESGRVPGLAAGRAPVGGGAGAALAPSPGGRAMGRVVDGAGRPVLAARVVAFPGDAESVTLEAAEGRATATTTSRAGAFEVALDTASTFSTLVVTAPGYPPHVRPGVALGRPVEVVLEAALAMEGRVLAADGAAVPGARVRVVGRLGPVPLVRETTAGAGGVWRVDFLPPSPTLHPERSRVQYVVEARAAGFAPLAVRAYPLPPGGTTRVVLVLRRGGTASGRLIDAESGRPLAGGQVLARSSVGFAELDARGRGTSRWGGGPPEVVSVSGLDGTWRAEHVASLGEGGGREASAWDRGHLTAVAPGYAEETKEVPAAGADGEVRLDFALSPTAAVTGRVVDEAGRPVAGCWVEGSRTDGDGRFSSAVRARRAEATPVRLRVVPPEGSWLEAPEVGSVEVRAGETTPLRDPIVLGRRAFAQRTLLVADERGEPVVGAHVGAWEWADREGRIVLRDLPGRPRRGPFVVEAEGFARTTVRAADWGVDGDSARVVLQAGRRLVGRVTTTDGDPVAGAGVVAVASDVPDESLLEPASADAAVGVAPGTTVLATAATGPDGSFRLDDLPPGPLRLLARKFEDGLRWPRGGSVLATVVDVAAGATEALATLPPSAAGPETTLVGETVDRETGRPVTGRASLALARESEEIRWDVGTAADFEVPRVPPGRWAVTVSVAGYAPERVAAVEVREGAPPLRIAVGRGITLRGRALLPDGVTGEHRVLRFSRLEGDASSAPAIEAPLARDGAWSASGFVAGDYRVLCVFVESSVLDRVGWLCPPDGARVSVPEDAGDAVVEVPLVPGAWLEVGVRDPRLLPGDPWGPPRAFDPRRAEVSARARYAVLDSAGRAVVTAGRLRDGHQARYVLPRGVYGVRLDVAGDPPESRTVRLGADPDPRVWFDRRPATAAPRSPAPVPGKDAAGR
jgi:RNA polymerase sigma-70 factor (ECF subfamily)